MAHDFNFVKEKTCTCTEKKTRGRNTLKCRKGFLWMTGLWIIFYFSLVLSKYKKLILYEQKVIHFSKMKKVSNLRDRIQVHG